MKWYNKSWFNVLFWIVGFFFIIIASIEGEKENIWGYLLFIPAALFVGPALIISLCKILGIDLEPKTKEEKPSQDLFF